MVSSLNDAPHRHLAVHLPAVDLAHLAAISISTTAIFLLRFARVVLSMLFAARASSLCSPPYLPATARGGVVSGSPVAIPFAREQHRAPKRGGCRAWAERRPSQLAGPQGVFCMSLETELRGSPHGRECPSPPAGILHARHCTLMRSIPCAAHRLDTPTSFTGCAACDVSAGSRSPALADLPGLRTP